MRRPTAMATTCLAGALLAPLALAQQDYAVEYVVDLERARSQMIDVELILRDVDADRVELRLPVWRPGRYAVNDHASGVQDVAASGPDGEPLDVRKTDKSTWEVATGGAGEVRVAYSVFANEMSLRTRHADDTHAFIDASATLMYWPQRRDEPLRVRIEAPDDWRIATGLEPDPQVQRAVVAPDYDVLVDSPMEIGLHDLIAFDVQGVPHEIVLWGRGDWHQRDLGEDFARIVAEQASIFGDMPYERYVFMVHAQPGAGGGTEHINSTIVGADPAVFESDSRYHGFLRLISHEMFHTWNVKQLRPAGIVPYDYQRENYTDLLWVAEGTTSYYDGLTLARAGIISEKDYFDRIGGQINSWRNSRGRRHQSLSEASFDAWISYFAGRHEHSPNVTVNFYTGGAVASLLLDLQIRERTGGEVTLDRVLREMYERFPLQSGGYTTEDLASTINELTGQDFRFFFDSYVHGREEMPLEAALETIGLTLERNRGEDDEVEPWLGISLRNSGGLAQVTRVDAESPAWHAGLNVDDLIVALDGQRLGAGDLDDRLGKLQPGDEVAITYFRRDLLREATIALDEQPAGRWRVSKLKDPSDQQRERYESWLKRPWDPSAEGEDDAEDKDDAASDGGD